MLARGFIFDDQFCTSCAVCSRRLACARRILRVAMKGAWSRFWLAFAKAAGGKLVDMECRPVSRMACEHYFHFLGPAGLGGLNAAAGLVKPECEDYAALPVAVFDLFHVGDDTAVK